MHRCGAARVRSIGVGLFREQKREDFGVLFHADEVAGPTAAVGKVRAGVRRQRFAGEEEPRYVSLPEAEGQEERGETWGAIVAGYYLDFRVSFCHVSVELILEFLRDLPSARSDHDRQFFPGISAVILPSVLRS